MEIPEQLRYTENHEWALAEGDKVRVGITDFAQEALGDVVFLDLPPLGKQVVEGEVLGEIESTKSVSEIYSPVSGVVVETNAALGQAPEKVNEAPYGDGWICVIAVNDPTLPDKLLDAAAYRELTVTLE